MKYILNHVSASLFLRILEYKLSSTVCFNQNPSGIGQGEIPGTILMLRNEQCKFFGNLIQLIPSLNLNTNDLLSSIRMS